VVTKEYPERMIDVARADALIIEHCAPFGEETCSLTECGGRVLREDIFADREQPPFDRVAMDGIAIHFEAWSQGTRSFAVAGLHPAGRPAPVLADAGSCYEVMTGAVLPEGADCVVRVEDVDRGEHGATIAEDIELKPMQNVHVRGSDREDGAQLLRAGMRLGATEIAVAASVGHAELRVSADPQIAVVSNGDELVDTGDPVAPYQIRRSNVYALLTALRQTGCQCVSAHHFADDRDSITEGLHAILNQNDVVLLSGGVSMGRTDYIPEALAACGVTVVFHRVLQRPGLPFWFGIGATGQRVFAMPGNPVSTLVCFRRYVLPQLARCSGAGPRPAWAVLAEPFAFAKSLTYFLPVVVHPDEGRLRAEPRPTGGSGNFAALAGTDGFVELAAEHDAFAAGEVVPYHAWSI
jgi:molybdopterin molybdotransferase